MSWRPLPAVPAGVLEPCFTNVAGTIREFFCHPVTATEVVAEGIVARGIDAGSYRCEQIGSWPNGDVQIRCWRVTG